MGTDVVFIKCFPLNVIVLLGNLIDKNSEMCSTLFGIFLCCHYIINGNAIISLISIIKVFVSSLAIVATLILLEIPIKCVTFGYISKFHVIY